MRHTRPTVVSACVSKDQITLGEIVVDEKSNEITAIPQLLDMVDVADSVVTTDAMWTQTKIVEKIIEKKAYYCLALKGNHSDLHNDVKFYFENQAVETQTTTREKWHGRIETREYFLETEIDWLAQKRRRGRACS